MEGNAQKRTKTKIKRLASEVKVDSHASCASFLKTVYERLKQEYKPYSYYYFSEDIGLGHCPTSRLLINGSRNLTEKTAKIICEHLGIVGKQRLYFTSLAKASLKSGDAKVMDTLLSSKKELSSEFSKDQLEFFRHWYHAALLEFLRFYEGPTDPEAIGKKMVPVLSPGKVTRSLELLQALNYVAFDPKGGRFKVLVQQVHTAEDVAGLAFRLYHHQYLGLAREAINKHVTDDRTITGTTISVSPEVKQEAVRIMFESIRRIMDLADETKEPTEVCQLNMQLFPVAKK